MCVLTARVDVLSDHVLVISVTLSGAAGTVFPVWASVGLVTIHDPAAKADQSIAVLSVMLHAIGSSGGPRWR